MLARRLANTAHANAHAPSPTVSRRSSMGLNGASARPSHSTPRAPPAHPQTSSRRSRRRRRRRRRRRCRSHGRPHACCAATLLLPTLHPSFPCLSPTQPSATSHSQLSAITVALFRSAVSRGVWASALPPARALPPSSHPQRTRLSPPSPSHHTRAASTSPPINSPNRRSPLPPIRPRLRLGGARRESGGATSGAAARVSVLLRAMALLMEAPDDSYGRAVF